MFLPHQVRKNLYVAVFKNNYFLKVRYFQNEILVPKIFQKNTEKLEEFLAKNLKSGQKPKNKWMYFIILISTSFN